MDVSGDQGALPALLPTCVWQTTSQLTRVCSPPSPCSLPEATSNAGEKQILHTAQCSTCIFVCQKAWCRCPENVEIFKQVPLLQNVKQTQVNSESHINHIKHIHMQGMYSSLSVQPFCQQHIWKQNVLPSHVFWWPVDFPISQEDEFGCTSMVSNKYTDIKDDGKRKCNLPFFCSKGKYSDSCVRRNMLTQDSLYSLQWPPKPLPNGGHLMTINYSCTHTVCVLMQVGINMFGLMKTWIYDLKAMLES